MKVTKEELKLDDLNWEYFQSLYQQKLNPRKDKLVIGKNAFPTAIAPESLLKFLPYGNYEDLQKNKSTYIAESKKLALWIKKTHGGGGTSVRREKYLRQIQGAKDFHLGAKGTDLFVNLKGKRTSLAELQILQAIGDLKKNKFSEIYFHNIVSAESKSSVDALWLREEYKNLNSINFHYFAETFQSTLPTIDETGALSLNRVAPGGHGFFAVDALLSALDEKNALKLTDL